jgi:hypothetical protein
MSTSMAPNPQFLSTTYKFTNLGRQNRNSFHKSYLMHFLYLHYKLNFFKSSTTIFTWLIDLKFELVKD